MSTIPTPAILPTNYQGLPKLSAIIPAKQVAGMTIDLKGQSYLNDSTEFTVPGVTINGPGTIIDVTGTASSTGIGTTVAATHFTANGVTRLTDKPMAKFGTGKVGKNAFRLYGANPSIIGCNFTDFDDSIFVGSTAASAILTTLYSFRARGDDLYIAGAKGGVVNVFVCPDGSTQEHCIRFEVEEATNANTGGNWTLNDVNLLSADGKECIAAREFGGGITINRGVLSNKTFAGLRAGQLPNDGSAPCQTSAPNIHLNGTHFTGGAFVQMDQGTRGLVMTACIFDWCKANVPIRFSGPFAGATISKTILNLNGQPFDHRLYVTGAMASGDNVTVSGTVDEHGAALVLTCPANPK